MLPVGAGVKQLAARDVPWPLSKMRDEVTESALGAGRRLADVVGMVRTWADQGSVHPRVAARFVRVQIDEQARRLAAWHAYNGPRRRRDD